MNDELKPCFICGKSAELIQPNNKQAHCSDHNCIMYYKPLIIEHWQTRPAWDAQAAELATLREELSIADKHLATAVKQIETLTAERDYRPRMDDYEQLRARLAEAEEALKYYTDATYVISWMDQEEADDGEKARAYCEKWRI